MTSARDLPVRDDLRGERPYGAPLIDAAIRLNTNENPFAPSSELVGALTRRVTEAALTLNRYPDIEASRLRDALAQYVTDDTGRTVTSRQIWPANGSNEILQQLLQAFGGPGRTALGFEPTYSMHRLICRGTGTRYHAAPRATDFSLPVELVARAVADIRPDVVFLCSPNNPTGSALAPEVVAAVCDATPGLVIVDEAYGEFSKQASAVTALVDRPRLVVVRTMSKAFALAGARVGYAIADPAVVETLQLVRLPYHLSSLTQAVALAALDHAGELLAHVDELVVQRDRISTELSGLGYAVADSDANFVFFAVNDESAAWQSLLDRGVLVRDMGIPGYLRVTAGTAAETTAFLDAVRQIAKENVA